MSQPLVFVLLMLALVLPAVGAILLRLLRPYLSDQLLLLAAVMLFGIAIASTLVLGRSEITTLRVAGLTLLLPETGPPDFDPSLQPSDPAPLEPPIPIETPAPGEPTAEPTATPEPTAEPTTTPEPTDTPEPTAEPTATPEPTAEPTATPEPTAEPTAPPAPSEPRRYTIEPGDTLRAIAERFGVSVQAILEANDLTPEEADNLRPGQELIIP